MTEIPISKYVQIPWKERGRDFEGCDCYGLVKLVLAEEFKIDVPDFFYEESAMNHSELIDLNKPTLQAEEVQAPLEGDIVIMMRGKYPTHMGIYLDGGYILHTDRKLGTCCERSTGWRLRGRIEGYYRVQR